MGEQVVMQRAPIVMSGVGLAAALALWAWLPAGDEVVDVASAKGNQKPSLQSAGPPAILAGRTPAKPTTAPPVPSLAQPSTTTVYAGPITVAAPQQLYVGEMNDLVVGVGENESVNEVSYTVQFDPDVLQARVGTEGDWATGAGLDPRFAAEISDAGDRVQIRSAVSAQRSGMQGRSVALVQFLAVAPGTTTVLITDVVVKDVAGRSMTSADSALNLQMTVESAPPQPEAWRQRRAVVAEPPAETTEEGD